MSEQVMRNGKIMSFVFLRGLIFISLFSYFNASQYNLLPEPKEFSYKIVNGVGGPSSWGSRFSWCEGTQQSPVELEDLPWVRSLFAPLRLDGHASVREDDFIMQNTGHLVQLKYSGDAPLLRGGPLSSTYVLSHVFFHWGTDGGSEHALNHQFHGMEVQMVHYKREHSNIINASADFDGLAVVAILLATSRIPNLSFAAMVSKLREVKVAGSSTFVPKDTMHWLRHYVNKENYYTYQGSLTTPPCSEIVTWIVMKQPTNIGVKQIQEFQKLSGQEGLIVQNKRPLQELNGRQVFYCARAARHRVMRSPAVILSILAIIIANFV